MIRKNMIRITVITCASVMGFAFALCRVFDLPAPTTILAMAMNIVPPTKTYRLFDSNDIVRPKQAKPFREAPADIAVKTKWRDGTAVSLEDFLDLTNTKAFLVVHDDRLVMERYFDGARQDTLFPSYSLSKSVMSSLVGIASAKNLLSTDDEIGKYVPSASISDQYRRIKVDDLLNMRSGIDVEENYFSIWAPIVKMYLTTDLDGFIGNLQGFRFEPGSRFEYRSVDSQILGRVLREVTGVSVSTYLDKELWEPLGAEYAASWSVDSSRHGIEKAFCCFNAAARDFAKFGSLYLHRGNSDGRQLLNADWVARQSSPSGIDTQRSLGYSNNWWIPLNNKEDGDFVAIGIHGQYIYVNPKKKTVIVKLSEHEVEEDVLLTLATFQLISNKLDSATYPVAHQSAGAT